MKTNPPTPPPMSGDVYRAFRALIDVLRRQIGDRQLLDFRSTVSDLLKAYEKEGHSKRSAREAIISLLKQGILQSDSILDSFSKLSIVGGEGDDPQPSVSTTTKPSFEQINFHIGERFTEWAKHNRSDELDRTLQLLKRPQARAIVLHLWDGQRHSISSLLVTAFREPNPSGETIRKAIDRVNRRFVEKGLRYEIQRYGQDLQLHDLPKT